MDEKDAVTRYRIMAVAAKRLARRKFADVSLTDIGRDLTVDRSVVRKHYPSMEELLTALIESFLQSIEETLLPFVHGVFAPAIDSGDLEIRTDRLHFGTPQHAAIFSNQVIDHLEAMFDFLLVHRDEYFVFVQESLGSGAHSGCMEKMMRLLLPLADNPLFSGRETISEMRLPSEVLADYMQSNILPILGYALFKEKLDQITPLCTDTHKKKILDDIRDSNARHVIGQDIFFAAKQ